jgi:hypothetical protein
VHKACLKSHRFCFKFASEALPRYPSFTVLGCSYLSTSLPLLYCAPLQPPPPRYSSFAVLRCSYLSISLPLFRYDLLQLPFYHIPIHRLYSDTSPPLYPSFAATSPPRYPAFTCAPLQLPLHHAIPPSAVLRCSYPLHLFTPPSL